jgi:ATP-binding cassette subfamily B protein
VLDTVSYTYPDTATPAVRGVSLRVEPGEIVALVGENGSGKSTLAKLAAGLYQPTAGSVRLDGSGTASSGEPLTGLVSAVFQDFARYDLTVRENVWLGAPWRGDDTAAIQAALADAGAAEPLQRLPEGLDARLGRRFEGGLGLSIGQWQRLALARAFYSPAPLLVLDEPTAAMDPKVEADLFDRIRELCAGRGVLLVSHRFSTVRSADRIVVLDEGQVVEEGTHDALMARHGVYAALYETQAERYR